MCCILVFFLLLLMLIAKQWVVGVLIAITILAAKRIQKEHMYAHFVTHTHLHFQALDTTFS